MPRKRPALGTVGVYATLTLRGAGLTAAAAVAVGAGASAACALPGRAVLAGPAEGAAGAQAMVQKANSGPSQATTWLRLCMLSPPRSAAVALWMCARHRNHAGLHAGLIVVRSYDERPRTL